MTALRALPLTASQARGEARWLVPVFLALMVVATRAIWLGLVSNAVRDGYLAEDIPAELIMQSMAHVTGGALLSWAMGGLPTSALTATVGIGYALCLKGSATAQGLNLLQERIEAYQAKLSKAGPKASERAPETL